MSFKSRVDEAEFPVIIHPHHHHCDDEITFLVSYPSHHGVQCPVIDESSVATHLLPSPNTIALTSFFTDPAALLFFVNLGFRQLSAVFFVGSTIAQSCIGSLSERLTLLCLKSHHEFTPPETMLRSGCFANSDPRGVIEIGREDSR